MPTKAALRKQMEWQGRHEDPAHAEQAYINFRTANPQLKPQRKFIANMGQLYFDRCGSPVRFPLFPNYGTDHHRLYRDGATGLYVVVCHPYDGGRYSQDVVNKANKCQLFRWEGGSVAPDKLLCRIAPPSASWYGAGAYLVVIASEKVEVQL